MKCTKHPRYKGRTYPNRKCRRCKEIWNSEQQKKIEELAQQTFPTPRYMNLS